jgi:hypothetical protein
VNKIVFIPAKMGLGHINKHLVVTWNTEAENCEIPTKSGWMATPVSNNIKVHVVL